MLGMQPTQRWPLALALTTSVAVGALAACEPRIEEPASRTAPSQVGSTKQSQQASADAAASVAVGDPRLRGRCIRPLPATPARPASSSPDPRCPEDPEPERIPLPRRGSLSFPDAKLTLSVEVARRYEDRMRGLMYRRSLSDQEGMIFVFERRMDHRFWMRNTCLSLDMLYIDDDGLIVGIQENVPTLNDHTYYVGCPSRYVLEVPAGWSRRHGVQPGHFIRFDRL